MSIYHKSRRARAGRNPKCLPRHSPAGRRRAEIQNPKMLLKRFVLLFLVGLVATLTAGARADVTKRALVKPIEESKLDEMLSVKYNRLVVTFMAAWCGPCVDELPVLNKLYQKYEKSGLKLIGISIDLEGSEAMQPIVDKLSIKFPVYWYGEKAVKKFNPQKGYRFSSYASRWILSSISDYFRKNQHPIILSKCVFNG